LIRDKFSFFYIVTVFKRAFVYKCTLNVFFSESYFPSRLTWCLKNYWTYWTFSCSIFAYVYVYV